MICGVNATRAAPAAIWTIRAIGSLYYLSMRPTFVFVATVLGMTACGEDPILQRAREEAAASAAAGGAGGAAPAPPPGGGDPGGPGGGTPPTPGPDGTVAPPPGGGEPPPFGYEGPGSAPVVAAEQKPGVPVEPTPAPEGSPGGAAHAGAADPPPGGAPGAAVGAPPEAGPSVTVTGVVEYAAWKQGGVRVDAFDGDHTVHGNRPGVVASARIDRPGTFTLTVPAGTGKIYVEAVVDEDLDGRPGPQDPRGTADRYPVTVKSDAVSGLLVRLVKHDAPGGKGGKDF